MRSFFLEREGQQLCPCCRTFMHIFAPYIPLGGWWHELIWRLRNPFPWHLFLLLLVGWYSNRRLGSMYEPIKPPARVCCEIFTNVRWKQIKVTKKSFLWLDEIWDFNLVHHKSILVLTPLTKSLPHQQRWLISLLLTFQSLLWSTRNAKWIVRVACSRSGHKTDPWTSCGHSYV